VIYLIGGPARAGKTFLAKKLLQQYGISIFSTDFIVVGLGNGMQSFGIHEYQTPAEVAVKLWPLCKEILIAMMHSGITYCVEGAVITPEHIYELQQLYPGKIKACFLGYCEVDGKSKLSEDKEHFTGNDWLQLLPEDKALECLQYNQEQSIITRDACLDYGYEFFDTSLLFLEQLARAERSLMNDDYNKYI
jgi:hypothetical protein